VLRETCGRVSGPRGAAQRLGMKRGTLLDRMRRLGISARDVKAGCEAAMAEAFGQNVFG